MSRLVYSSEVQGEWPEEHPFFQPESHILGKSSEYFALQPLAVYYTDAQQLECRPAGAPYKCESPSSLLRPGSDAWMYVPGMQPNDALPEWVRTSIVTTLRYVDGHTSLLTASSDGGHTVWLYSVHLMMWVGDRYVDISRPSQQIKVVNHVQA